MPLAGQNGQHEKKCNYFMLVLHPENSVLLKINHNYKYIYFILTKIIKENKSRIYFKHKKITKMFILHVGKMDHRSGLVIFNDTMNLLLNVIKHYKSLYIVSS